MSYIEQLLGQNEEVVLITRQHWMMLLPAFLANAALALLIVLVSAIVAGPLGNPLGVFATALLIIPVARFVYQYLVWVNQEYIVTNRRVIQIEGIVNKDVTDSSLEKVNDVKMSQSVLGRMLDYGDVEILTASELGANLFKRIKGPIKFKTAMLNQKELLETGEGVHRPADAAPMPANIPAMIAGLDQLRKQGAITEEEFNRKKQDLLARM
jgi:uncharacterized membrane protein YdbT with pleckstrin-like domain